VNNRLEPFTACTRLDHLLSELPQARDPVTFAQFLVVSATTPCRVSRCDALPACEHKRWSPADRWNNCFAVFLGILALRPG